MLEHRRSRFLWTWVIGTVNPAEYCGWGMVWGETLEFYRVYGMWRLKIPALYIKNKTLGV